MPSTTVLHPRYPRLRRARVTEVPTGQRVAVDYRRPDGSWQEVQVRVLDWPLHAARDAALVSLMEDHTP